jgi:hypothetical protein
MTVITWTITKHKVVVGIAVLIGVAGILLIADTLWKVSRTLKSAEAGVAQAGVVAFRAVSLDRPLPAGFESVSAPAQFRGLAGI